MTTEAPVTHAGAYPISKSLLLDLTKIRAPFNDIPVENAYIGKKLAHDWQLHLISEDSRTGYDGALFSADINGEPHYFIYHQGSNDIKDIPSAARLANGKEPQQAQDARAFTDRALQFIADHHPGQQVPIVQVGYSIGGTLAILTSRDGQPVIAFDPPGTRKLLQKQGQNPNAIGQRALEILSPHPNLANAQGEHIGHIIEAGEKFWQTDKISTADFIRMSVQTHNIKNIGLGLADTDDFTATPASQAKRPTEMFDAFRAYLKDHMGPNPSFGERLLSASATVADTLRLDKLATKALAFATDRIAGKFSTDLAESGQRQEYRRPLTHPDVQHNVPEHLPTVEPPTKSYAQDILAARQQAATAARQI